MQHQTFNEFLTVDILLQSEAKTRAVDAFAISWVKVEKQLRRLTSNLVFQHSIFRDGVDNHKDALRNAISKKKTTNHHRFIGAIYRLSGCSVKEMVGDPYKLLKKDIDTSHGYRNKILHGLQTGQSLSRSELEEYIMSMRKWCELLADGASTRIGYDGFSSNSLRQNGKEDITENVNTVLADGWASFINRI